MKQCRQILCQGFLKRYNGSLMTRLKVEKAQMLRIAAVQGQNNQRRRRISKLNQSRLWLWLIKSQLNKYTRKFNRSKLRIFYRPQDKKHSKFNKSTIKKLTSQSLFQLLNRTKLDRIGWLFLLSKLLMKQNVLEFLKKKCLNWLVYSINQSN